MAICALITALFASNSMSSRLPFDSARRLAASSDLRALAMSTAATPARDELSTSGTTVRAVSNDSLRGGGAARTQYCGYRQTQDNSVVQLHDLDLNYEFGRYRSTLRRCGAFSLLTQRLEAREHFIRRFARIGALGLGHRKLGEKVRLRSCAFRLLLLFLGQRALGSAQLVARLLQLHGAVLGFPKRLLSLLNRGVALSHALFREIRRVLPYALSEPRGCSCQAPMTRRS